MNRGNAAVVKYVPQAASFEALRWEKHGQHPKVRTAAGAHPGTYHYGVVDTVEGPRPIEPGDWLVIDEAGHVAPWRHEQFLQVFGPVVPAPASGALPESIDVFA